MSINPGDPLRVTLVEPGPQGTTIACQLVKDSHPSPRFSDVAITLLGLRASEGGTRLLANLHLSGTVRSRICDLTWGEQGSIRGIVVRVNWEPVASVSMSAKKSNVWESFAQPYPMSARFETELEVDVSTGNNFIELFATDSVTGFGLTGFVSFVLRIGLEDKDPGPGQQQDPPARHAVGEFVFLTWKPQLDRVSSGGQLHVYYSRLIGPSAAIETIRQINPARIVSGPDDEFYLAGTDGRPEPAILMLAADTTVRETTALGNASFESGFLEGFIYRRAAFVRGPLEIQRNPRHTEASPFDVVINDQVTRNLQIFDRNVANLGSRLSEFSPSVQAVHEFLQAVNSKRAETLLDIAVLDWERLYAHSRELALLGQYSLGLVDEVLKALSASASPAELGEAQGRICCETLACLIAEQKAGNMTKERVLAKLVTANRLGIDMSALLERVISAWKALPFG